MDLLGGMFVVMGFPGAALELVIRLRLALETPVAARAGEPPGELVDVLPTTAPAGEPPGRPVARDPMMALEGAPPGRPAVRDPIMALEGAPTGWPVTGDPMIALEETPARGCTLTEPPGKALVWAGRPVAVAASKTKAASRISPTRAGYNLALKKDFVLYMK